MAISLLMSAGWVMGKVVLLEICPRKKVSGFSMMTSIHKTSMVKNYKRSKGGKCVSGSFCWKSLCVVSVVFAILGLLAGVAIYMDPESSFLDLMPMGSTLGTSSTTQENSNINSSVGGGKNGSNMTTASISASGDNADSEASLILTTLGGTSESMNNLTTTGENPGKEEEKAFEEKKKRKKTNKVEEEDKSDKPGKSAKSSEAWTSSSFSSSASPEEDLLRLFSGQMSSTSSQR